MSFGIFFGILTRHKLSALTVQAVGLSIDHKPELDDEKQRITAAGGFIHAGRVNGSLNLTRAIGMHFEPCYDILFLSPSICSARKSLGVTNDISFVKQIFFVIYIFVYAGDMEFKYQTDLPPDKQIVTCCPDIKEVNPALSCHRLCPLVSSLFLIFSR